ncbi:peptidase domain-containing ABC transporter [Bradyrhizobium sp. 83012]|uniref:Peptidase domain-containing ABC transporter n=1 Tax=Bradyrhizobium aeschynomenes TaxID=2734909 RepID=A0ABX2CPT8_9BRAD|nr:peptidase domain-containing ABC transporter [Bradyrhizobium aeschynomenes]NPU15643.1 peptidase domain-containing ABC transporter [Bradyrhizobium aeschynomenes]NPU69700.1 peptidase domain-containing ABC transporter [Bradyrhizobium aeschynomenes]
MYKKIPRVKQHDATDCGAASLACIAEFYGRRIPIARLRQYASTGPSGASIAGLTQAAHKIGFTAKGVKGQFESLYKIPKPAIALVKMNSALNHYVVVRAIDARRVTIMDPAHGEIRRLSHEQFRVLWTGVLLILAPAERFVKGDESSSSLLRLLSLLAPHRWVAVQALFGAIVTTVLGLSSAIYVQKIVDHVIVAGNRNLLNLLSLIMLALIVPQVVIGLIKGQLILQTGQKIDVGLVLGYYNHVIRLPRRFFDDMRTGEILSRINDAFKIRLFLNELAVSLLVNLLIIVLSVGMMVAFSWRLAVFVVAAAPLYALVFWAINKLNAKNQRDVMEGVAELDSQLVESLGSIGTIQAFGMEEVANFKVETRFVKVLHSVYSSGLIGVAGDNAVACISMVLTVIIMWCGAALVLEQILTPGELMSCYTLFGHVVRPVTAVVQSNRSVQDAFIAADRLFEIFDLELSCRGGIEIDELQYGDIRLESVTFRHSIGQPLFQDLSLTVRRGELTALVGESGSGKSSLASLLQNVYPVEKGCIKIGAYDLREIASASLRRLLAIVPQSVDVFSGSVVENIALGCSDPDVGKIVSICDRVGLRETIDQWPSGLWTHLGERGMRLSGGERQRLALARALYRDAEVLILDEPTASLDALAEDVVTALIEELRHRGKTIVVISHRLRTICCADKIAVLDGGKIVAEGRHSDLLENCEIYARLWQRQAALN